MSRSAKAVPHGTVPAWVAFCALPLVMFGNHLSWDVSLMPPLVDPDILQLAGMVVVAVLSMAVGPHLATLFALTLAMLFALDFTFLGHAWAIDGLIGAQRGVVLGLVACAGVSTSGAAPGLRYALMTALYVAANLAHLLPIGVLDVGIFFSGLYPLVGGVILLIPTVTWWFAKAHPRVGREGATQRSAIVALVCSLIAVCAVTSTQLLWRNVDPFDMFTAQWVNAASVVAAGVPMILLCLVLQLMNRPARMGIGAGAGAMIMALTVVVGWSNPDLPAWIWAGLLGLGEMLLLPWAWARATSDAHWRLAGPLALVLLAPLLITDNTTTLFPIAAALVLAIAAIPVGMLGFLADAWVFGEEPGSERARTW